ncbi:MAG TPA: hypothetical protein VN577_07270 [Terriglobales bacterium]|nr:hypothetical protein [Terriglobales bacterium]
MDMIERYLQAVKFALPEAQRDDIVKELRDSILSQVEEQEGSLGRPLTEGETAELLKRLGSPFQLASRYRKQQFLVSPTLFPIYWKVLKAALGIALLVSAAGCIAIAAAGKPIWESLRGLLQFPNLAITVFAWVTLVFVGMEFFGAKFQCTERWDPRALPPLVKDAPRKSRFELIAELLIELVLGVWWLTGLHYNYLIMGPGANYLNFGPVWLQLYPLFVALVCIDVGFTAAQLYRPQWTSGARISVVVKGAVGLVVLYFLLNAPDLMVPVNPTAQWQNLVHNLNRALHLGLTVAFIVIVVNIGISLVKLIGKRIGRAHQAIVGS